MRLEEGMYVRTAENGIDKFIFKAKDKDYDFYWYYFEKTKMTNPEIYVLKASHNILDLINKKDIILGVDGNIYEVSKVLLGYVYTKTKTKEGLVKTLVDYQIEKILTYEQFNNNAYEV